MDTDADQAVPVAARSAWRRWWQVRLDAISWLLALGLLVLVLSWVLRRWWFFADLLAHFMLTAVVVALVVIAVAVWRRRWRQVNVLVALVALSAWPLRTYVVTTSPDGLPAMLAPVRPVRVVTWNVLAHNGAPPSVVAARIRATADVAVVLETDARFWQLMRELRDEFPYRRQLLGGAFGQVVLSRWPLQGKIRDTDKQLPYAAVTIRPPSWPQPLLVLGVHTMPPLRASSWQANWRYSAALAATAQDHVGPVVAAGDWNATPTGALLSAFASASGTRRLSAGLWPTWGIRRLPGASLQIDHIFVRGLHATPVRLGEYAGSDHRWLATTVQPLAQ